MNDPDPFAPISVSDHAEERAFERLGWERPAADRIRGEVRSALLSGRVTTVRPNWTRGWTEDELPRLPMYRFVWDADASRCWLLEIHRGGQIKVVTAFSGTDEVSERAEERHVRKGMKRRPA